MTRLLFISTKNRWFFRLTLFTTLLAFTLILLSSYCRSNGIMGICTDWPLCNGHVLVPHIATLWLDFNNEQIVMGLRYLILAMTLATVGLTCLSYRLQRQLGMQPFMVCLPLLVCCMAEIFLNKLTATQNLHPSLILLNTLIEFSLLGLLWWLGRISKPNAYSKSHASLRQWRPWAWLAFLLFLMQLTFGGWLKIHTAEANCALFPYCNMQLTPSVNWDRVLHHFMLITPENLASVHHLHRLGALTASGYLFLFSLILTFNRYLYPLGFTLLLLLVGEFALGLFSPEWLQIPAKVSQYAIIGLLLLALISLLTNLYNKPQDYLYG